MDKFKRLAVVFTVFYLVFGFNSIWCTESNGAEKTREKLSQTRYVNPKGYFKITPPRGWRIVEYSQDPRGKVAFISDFRDVLEFIELICSPLSFLRFCILPLGL